MDAFAILLETLNEECTLRVATHLERFDSHPLTSPEIVFNLEPDNSISIELSGNAELIPKLSQTEYGMMVLLGWTKPMPGKDEDYGEYQFFTRNYPEGTPKHELTLDLMTALVKVYGMKRTDSIGVEFQEEADLLIEHGKLFCTDYDENGNEQGVFRLYEPGERWL